MHMAPPPTWIAPALMPQAYTWFRATTLWRSKNINTSLCKAVAVTLRKHAAYAQQQHDFPAFIRHDRSLASQGGSLEDWHVHALPYHMHGLAGAGMIGSRGVQAVWRGGLQQAVKLAQAAIQRQVHGQAVF